MGWSLIVMSRNFLFLNNRFRLNFRFRLDLIDRFISISELVELVKRDIIINLRNIILIIVRILIILIINNCFRFRFYNWFIINRSSRFRFTDLNSLVGVISRSGISGLISDNFGKNSDIIS